MNNDNYNIESIIISMWNIQFENYKLIVKLLSNYKLIVKTFSIVFVLFDNQKVHLILDPSVTDYEE